jgi:hypothetical protein
MLDRGASFVDIGLFIWGLFGNLGVIGLLLQAVCSRAYHLCVYLVILVDLLIVIN